MSGRVEISHTAKANSAFAATWLIQRMNSTGGKFRLVLAGGETPRELYRMLASKPLADQIPWPRLELFFGDERFVPPTDRMSNFRMVYETLIEGSPLVPGQVYPMPTDGTPEEAAQRYETLLKNLYGADRLDPAKPLFDVVLLGLGAEGHAASLFPGSTAIDEKEHWVAAVKQTRPPHRLTLTYPAIESSHSVAFLVSGEAKNKAVLDALAGNPASPAARIKPKGEMVWFLDRGAAGALRSS